jgi:hypothetical protein
VAISQASETRERVTVAAQDGAGPTFGLMQQKHLKKPSSYIERLGYGNYEPQRETKLSFVQEEWQFAIFYANVGVMQCIPIVRAGEPERMAAAAGREPR